MTDLTAITTPFGLLDRETQEALKAELLKPDGKLEMFDGREWCDSSDSPAYTGWLAYRVKPAPPRPREWWAVGQHLHDTEAEAVSFRQACADVHGTHHLRTPIIHVREVLE